MKSAAQQVFELLPQLSALEIQEVKKRILALGGISPVSANEGKQKITIDVPTDDWLLEGILEELRRRRLGSTIPPQFRIKNLRSFSSYSPKAERVKTFISENYPKLSVLEKKALGLILGRCLARSLESWADISLDTMLRNVDKVPEALDKSFPGYLRGGLLPVLLKSQRENLSSIES